MNLKVEDEDQTGKPDGVVVEWVKKGHESLEKEKLDFIQQIKKFKKEELLPTKKEKISIWSKVGYWYAKWTRALFGWKTF